MFVWPGKLEATSEAGLQARVPYRLTCVRVTAFESRFRGARNALLAGTTEGLALAFDWGCLLRDSAVGRKKNERRSAWDSEMLAPSVQVKGRIFGTTSKKAPAFSRFLDEIILCGRGFVAILSNESKTAIPTFTYTAVRKKQC